jgi:hypothetical protein
MRTYWVYFAISFLVIFSHNATSAIRNGYERGIDGARTSIKALEAAYSKSDLTTAQRKRIKEQVRLLTEFVYYHELTESRIAEFRQTAPSLWDSVNYILDARGRSVDVYIRFVELEDIPSGAYATTSLEQGADEDAYRSCFGEHTISVTVRKGPSDLRKLAHELGHITYQVPNLATYTKYYNNMYESMANGEALGHGAGDPSGMNAERFERLFTKLSLSAHKNP